MNHVPTSVAGYRITATLGTGGMGTVFLAKDPRAPEPGWVALKVLHAHLGAEAETRLEFVEEARLAVRISHPNVVQVRQLGDDPAGMFIAMEYVPGTTFHALLKSSADEQTRPPAGLTLRILDDVLQGLQAAHELRDEDGKLLHLVHRDISPPNILIGLDGWTRVTDFGIAKALSRQSYTEKGIIKGRTGYIAPEQMVAKPLDRRCDLWGVAVLAWEALAGQRLFPGDDFEALRRTVQEDAPLLAPLRPDLPPAFCAVIARGLARAPEERFPTAEALRTALLEAWSEAGGALASREDVAALATRLQESSRKRPATPMPFQEIAPKTEVGTSLTRASPEREPVPAVTRVAEAERVGTSLTRERRGRDPVPAVTRVDAASREGALSGVAAVGAVPGRETASRVDAASRVDGMSGPGTAESLEATSAGKRSVQRDHQPTRLATQPHARSHGAWMIAVVLVVLAAGSWAIFSATREAAPTEQRAKADESPRAPAPVGLSSTAITAAQTSPAPQAGPGPKPESRGPEVAANSPSASPVNVVARSQTDRQAEKSVPERRVRRSVNVTANVEIAQLRVGTRLIAPALPSRQLSVELLNGERNRSLRVEGIAKDGRRGSAWLPAGTDAVQLTLAPRARPRTAPAAREEEPKDDAPLAKNPYEDGN